MGTREIIQLFDAHVMTTYGRFPLALTRGEGCRVWDADGREYLDFVAGIAVCSLGHAHPAMLQAIQEAASQLIHCSNLYYIEPQGRLAAWLTAKAGMDRAFFCNSGAEANEAAIKLARRWAKKQGRPEAFEIITAENSFHGRTLATVTATGQPKYHDGFEPLPAGFRHVPFNDLAALEAAVGPQTCAVLLEVVQGEGGVRPCDPAYLEGVQRLCRERGLLLMFDEVQTGMGRTGRWFAYQHYGLEPDVVTVAKALGGGIPIGACLARGEAALALEPGTHASTFGGNPFACRVALAVAQTMEQEQLPQRAEGMGALLAAGLRRLQEKFPQVVADVRGKGLLQGMECTVPAASMVRRAMDKGLLLVPAGSHVVRFVPPLVVSADEIRQALEVVEACLQEESAALPA